MFFFIWKQELSKKSYEKQRNTMGETTHYMNRKPNQDTNQKTTIKHQTLQEKQCFLGKNNGKVWVARRAPPHQNRSKTKKTINNQK